VEPERYFRERLEQSTSITTVLLAVGRADLSPHTRRTVVEELLDTYAGRLDRCLLSPPVLAAVARAGFDLHSRATRFWETTSRLREIWFDGEAFGDRDRRELLRAWSLELAIERRITARQAATLELLTELFGLQVSEVRDLRAARREVSLPEALPRAIEGQRTSGRASVPAHRRRLLNEPVRVEVPRTYALPEKWSRINDRVKAFRQAGVCPAPPVFTG
jgi:hypothetical protein